MKTSSIVNIILYIALLLFVNGSERENMRDKESDKAREAIMKGLNDAGIHQK